MEVDSSKFLSKLEDSEYGTGTIAEKAGIETSEVLALIENGEAELSVVNKLEEVIGEWEENNENYEGDTLEGKTIDEIKDMVNSGLVNREAVIEFELAKNEEEVRKTLIDWLEE